MAIAEVFLPEFEHEMASTRKLLEIVPTDNPTWKPHPKSSTISGLALHLANLPSWAKMTLTEDELDLNPPSGPVWIPPAYESREKTLETFDRFVAEAREIIAATSDEEMMKPWTLKSGGHAIFTLPRAAVLRTFVLSHIIHHRGQLDVYLRMNDVPLPSIYGPTADEKN